MGLCNRQFAQTFANIFEGKDKFNSERFSNKYTDASRVLATYYMRATETSGISTFNALDFSVIISSYKKYGELFKLPYFTPLLGVILI